MLTEAYKHRALEELEKATPEHVIEVLRHIGSTKKSAAENLHSRRMNEIQGGIEQSECSLDRY